MKAKEAIEITIDNALKIGYYHEEIQNRAKSGCNFALFVGFYITIDIIGQLMADGYQVKTGENQFGESYLRVTW